MFSPQYWLRGRRLGLSGMRNEYWLRRSASRGGGSAERGGSVPGAAHGDPTGALLRRPGELNYASLGIGGPRLEPARLYGCVRFGHDHTGLPFCFCLLRACAFVSGFQPALAFLLVRFPNFFFFKSLSRKRHPKPRAEPYPQPAGTARPRPSHTGTLLFLAPPVAPATSP